MESYLTPHHYDLVTPDGVITAIENDVVCIEINNISPTFVGYQIDKSDICFNLKSTLAQLGVNAKCQEIQLDKAYAKAEVKLTLVGLGELGRAMIACLAPGAYIGKLFAKDDRRRVRDPDYLMRMFGRSDRHGRPLLSLGGFEGSGSLILEKVEGRTVAFISLLDGIVSYEPEIFGFLPTLAKALQSNLSNTRQLIHLHQTFQSGVSRTPCEGEVLLVKTQPLHIRTVYAHVVDSLLPDGILHTAANVLQPDTTASGDIYEFYGNSNQTLSDVPLEFFTLEPHREHVFFADRDQLISELDNPQSLFKAFSTAPQPETSLASVFVVKGSQMENLEAKDWIVRDMIKHDFPGLSHPARQALVAEKYIEHQPAYPFLKAMEEDLISSQGILLTRHFPTPLLKRLLLSDLVQRCLKRIYFQHPSCSHNGFFSHEDRAMLVDLAKFGIPVFWVDDISKKILQFVLKPEKESGLFVPLPLIETFRKATFLGVYGSNLQEGSFEKELTQLLDGLLKMKEHMTHPLFSKDVPLALLTGGGPGAMEVGNRVAKRAGILSCANIVDFSPKDGSVINEQKQNPHIDAKMTYRLDRLVERQAEFYLDIPIFLPGGIGMDFEYTLEEVRRKTGSTPPNPILLFGSVEYWKRKVTSRFQLNRETGTIKGSEWVSNCFYCIQTAEQGLKVLQSFFEGKLAIGSHGPIYEDGFCTDPEKISFQ